MSDEALQLLSAIVTLQMYEFAALLALLGFCFGGLIIWFVRAAR